MLRSVIYLSIVLIFIMSIYYLLISNKNNKQLEKTKCLIIDYIIYDIITIIICYIGIVELDWDVIILIPTLLLSLILYLIAKYRINRILKKDNKKTNTNLVVYSPVLIISVLLVVFSYVFELFIINNCDYLLKYNHQDGIIISENTYIAIIYNRPITITLQKNLFKRQGKIIKNERYEIKYKNDDTISIKNNLDDEIDNEDIRKIAIDAQKKYPDVGSAVITYLPEGKYAIINLTSKFNNGVANSLEEQFYAKEKYIKSIKTKGSLETITSYK